MPQTDLGVLSDKERNQGQTVCNGFDNVVNGDFLSFCSLGA